MNQNLEIDVKPGSTADVLGNYVAGKINETDKFAQSTANGMVGAAEQFAAGTTDMAFEMMDSLMQDVVTKGVDALYEALGLNEETLQLTSKIVQSAKTATGIAKDVSQFIPIDKDAFPMAKEVFTELTLQYIQIILVPLIQRLTFAYYELHNAILMLDRDAVIELALTVGYEVLDTIIQLIEDQVFKYTGYTILEIYYKCAKGFQKMASYKRAKRMKRREQSQQTNNNTTAGDEAETDVRNNISQVNEHNKDPKLNVNIDEQQIKKDLIDWCMKQTDMLYNAFLLINLRDMCLDVKDTFQNISNEGYENIADSINSLDDFMTLLEDLGLGEAPTISFDDIVNQSLSVMQSAVGTAQNLASPNTVVNFAGSTGSSIANSTNVSVSTKPSFDIKSELNNNKGVNLNIVLHMDPNKKSVYRDLQESIKGIKYQKKSVFDNAKIKLIINNCIICWTNEKIDNFDVVAVTDDKNVVYTVNIKKDEYKEEEKPKETNNEPYVPIQLQIIEEAWQKEPDKDPNKKPLIEVINMIAQLIMPLSKLLQLIAHLIQNYRINKAFAKSQAGVSLAEATKTVMNAVGFIQDIIAKHTNEQLADGANFYTIRTQKTYDWLCKKFDIHPDDHNICTITSEQTSIFCTYAKQNDLLFWEQLNLQKSTVLYIDFDGIKQGNKKDGTTGDIDKMMYLDDLHEVMFTANMRPQMSSQILYCIKNNDTPNNIK